MSDDRYVQGLKVRRSVLGDAHVDRSLSQSSDFDREFQQQITRSAWGEVWVRPGLDKRTRHLLTLSTLAALGHQQELAMHLRATANTGVTAEEVKEVLMHLAVYAGVPAANAAFRTAKQVLYPAEATEVGCGLAPDVDAGAGELEGSRGEQA